MKIIKHLDKFWKTIKSFIYGNLKMKKSKKKIMNKAECITVLLFLLWIPST